MTFLAPWALAVGAAAALGAVLLHLVASTRPAVYYFPTAQFIPDQRTLVSRAATRPRDLLLLLLRLLVLIGLAIAFARPVLTPSRGAIARVIIVDLSRATANRTDAIATARRIVSDNAPFTLLTVDSSARVVSMLSLDSLRSTSSTTQVGSLSAALIAARRASAPLAERADSVQLVLVSPVTVRELDEATTSLRALWPGGMRVERIAAATDSAESIVLDRAVPMADPLGPALANARRGGSGHATRVVRTVATNEDSTFARGGGAVVQWDTTANGKFHADGLAAGNDVIVAQLGRASVDSGAVIARWSDGSAAATERTMGAGCMRHVGVLLPHAGDLALHLPFQRIARRLLAPCAKADVGAPVDSSGLAKLVGVSRAAARSSDLRDNDNRPSPIARWFLIIALVAAISELFVRARMPAEAA